MPEFGLVKSFDIDNGELDEMSPQQCFVLGFELAQVDELLKQKSAISRPVHAENQRRIEKSCQDAGRRFRLNWMPADPTESWLQLEVDPTG